MSAWKKLILGWIVYITGDKNSEEIVPVVPPVVEKDGSDKTTDKITIKPSKEKAAVTEDSSADSSASGEDSGEGSTDNDESSASGDEEESGESGENGDEDESGDEEASGDEVESGESADAVVTKRSAIPVEITG